MGTGAKHGPTARGWQTARSVARLNDAEMVAREYATTERLAARRLGSTAWLRGETEPWRLALAAIAQVRPRRVLDAGSGTGEFAALIAAPEVICIDSSEAAVAAARERGLPALTGDIHQLPFAEAEFDVVTCNKVHYHLRDPDAGIAEIARVLRAGGRFVGIYMYEDHLVEFWRLVGDPMWDEEVFGCDMGAELLGRHFSRIERRDAVTEAMWDTRDGAQAFLDTFVEMSGTLTAPEGPYPLKATCRNCVFVADK